MYKAAEAGKAQAGPSAGAAPSGAPGGAPTGDQPKGKGGDDVIDAEYEVKE
jgi:hypothetical protein